MSDMFSSPSKQAQSAAQTQSGFSDAAVGKAEDYINQKEQDMRGAIAGLPPNPYLAAASTLSPTQVNPNSTQGFQAPPPPQANALTQSTGSFTQPTPFAIPNPSNNPFLQGR